MLSDAAIHQAARRIARTRLRQDAPPRATLPDALRPFVIDEGYRMQAAASAMIGETLGGACGWKVGSTSPAMQAFLGIAYPCAGRLYTGTVTRDQAHLDLRRFHRLALECEVAVRLSPAIDRAAPDDRASLLRGVEAVMTSIEIVEWRWADWEQVGAASLIADDFFSWGCVLGPDNDPLVLEGAAEIPGGFVVDGAPQTQGLASNILGHPLASLGWLVGHARAQGTPLKAGEIVTLGAIGAPLMITARATVTARFTGLGAARVTIA
jgi:2-keto-4-pentenoate hydratase